MGDVEALVTGDLKAPPTLEEARLLLEQHVRTTRWGRRGLAAKLEIVSFERSGAFDVIFQSYTETRGAEATYEPYFHGARVDGPANGQAPDIWEIPRKMPPLFTREHKEIVRIPHTDEVRTCFGCQGKGRVTCSSCSGSGEVSCGSCGGSGSVTAWRTVTETDSQGNSTTRSESYSTTCTSCGGGGRVTCSTCGGDGKVTCGPCNGHMRLCHFNRMHVRWETRTNSHQIEKTDLPDVLVGGAGGDVILHEEEETIEQGTASEGAGPYRGPAVRVNAEVAAAANALIARHKMGANERLHRQRLVVRAVPVHEARYRWGKETRSFWIYGTDRQVHAPRFPLSPWRVGGAVLGGASIPAALLAAGVHGSHEPPYIPPPPPPPYQAEAPCIEPPPLPSTPPEPPPPPPLPSATAQRPKAPPGKTIVEIRTDPPGMVVYIATKKIGATPLFVTIPAGDVGLCKADKSCAVGRCTGKNCEPLTAVRLVGPSSERRVDIGPSDGDLVEVR